MSKGTQTDYDAVVIGSGAGGLTAAVAMARAGKKVLVLEQHYLPGGWCHSFSLEGYKFSPGVHYIGNLQPGGRLRETYEGLGVANDLTFLELNPDGFDHVQIGSVKFDIPKGKEIWRDRLKTRFPHQAKGIDTYVDGLATLHDELAGGMHVSGLADSMAMPWRIRHVLRDGFVPLSRYLDRHGITDPYLRAILCMQAGDHGMPPSKCPTIMHAAVVGHYFNGGYYPRGGGKALPKAFIKALRRHGGEIRTRTAVERILTEGRRAIGVRLDDGTEIRADIVISNADPGMTFGKLMTEDQVPRRLRWKLKRTTWSLSCLSLFMAVDMDARAAGLDSGNVWYTRSPDLEKTYDLASNPDLDSAELPGMFLTTTTLKDPTSRRDGIHTMESFCFVSHEAFKKWKDTSMGERPDDYTAFKERLTDRMFERIDEVVPGLSDKVVFKELGTPLTNRFYAAATEGNLYGIEKRGSQIGPFGFPVNTPIDGLYLCGASTMGHGVAGATFSGLAAAKMALNCKTSELLGASQQNLQIYPADHPEQWPEALRAKSDSKSAA